jgi:hypothetical protein
MNIFKRWKHVRDIKKQNKKRENPDVKGVTSGEISEEEFKKLKKKYEK